MKAALRLYFRRIETGGLAHIDNGKPTLILANHTASFLDAMITACFVRRRIYFFTRGDVFGNKLADKVLRSLGMLPVYRMIDGRDKLQLNDGSNEEALRILARGGAVLIFAEGASDISKLLKPLKKGPFRLAVTAAATLPEAPLLVPMGINYVNPTGPFGDAFLLASAPLKASDFPADTEPEAARAATEMMRAAGAALRPLVWHTDAQSRVQTGDTLIRLLQQEKPDFTFAQSRRLLEWLDALGEPAFSRLQEDAEEYRRVQKDYRLPETTSAQVPGAGAWTALLLLSPIALLAQLNRPPLRLARYIADTQVKHPDFWAAVFLSFGVVCMILWYAAWLIAGFLLQRPGLMAILLAAMVVSGIIYLKWYRPVLMSAIDYIKKVFYRNYHAAWEVMERQKKALMQAICVGITHL